MRGDEPGAGRDSSARGHTEDAVEPLPRRDEERHLAGELVAELGRKIAELGPAAVRIVTAEEAERERLDWFRLGWQEHERSVSGENGEVRPDPPVRDRRLRLAERERSRGEGEHDRAPDDDDHPLPIVGAADAEVRELMPHRFRPRGRDRP